MGKNKREKRKTFGLQCLEAENILNGKEEACQSILSKLLGPAKQQCTVENLRCAIKELGIKSVDISLVRSRLIELVYSHGHMIDGVPCVSDESKAFCITVLKRVEEDLGLYIEETANGVLITDLTETSPCKRVSDSLRGTIIVKVNGRKCPERSNDAMRLFRNAKAENIITICLARRTCPLV